MALSYSREVCYSRNLTALETDGSPHYADRGSLEKPAIEPTGHSVRPGAGGYATGGLSKREMAGGEQADLLKQKRRVKPLKNKS